MASDCVSKMSLDSDGDVSSDGDGERRAMVTDNDDGDISSDFESDIPSDSNVFEGGDFESDDFEGEDFEDHDGRRRLGGRCLSSEDDSSDPKRGDFDSESTIAGVGTR